MEEVNVKREVLAGITTFLTMSYILAVNPIILSAAGMPKDGVIFATAASAALATFLMGTYAKLPFALAPGMGLNAYFAYTVCGQMGVSWKTALSAVFLEGVIFLILTVSGVRSAIFKAIPKNLSYAISAGIGLFIALIGLKSSGIIEPSQDTLVKLGNLREFSPAVTIAVLILTAILIKRKVPGALLWGILLATTIGILAGKAKPPSSILGFPHPSAAFKLDFSSLLSSSIIPVVITFLIVDLFDTVGTLSALCTRLGIPLNDNKVSKALTCDAVGTAVGSLMGTSTVTTYVESASGVAAGGKTGITAVTVSVLFILSLFFYPLISAIPEFATAPALIYVGSFMMAPLRKIEWEDATESLPAFITLVGIPFTFSISDGMGLGFISYTLVKLLSGRKEEINPTLFIVTVIFLVKFFM